MDELSLLPDIQGSFLFAHSFFFHQISNHDGRRTRHPGLAVHKYICFFKVSFDEFIRILEKWKYC